MSWKAGVKTSGDIDWCYNALRFATQKEAEKKGLKTATVEFTVD